MHLKVKTWGWLLYAVSFVILAQSLPTFYFMLMPMDHWLTYYSVEPTRTEFKVGENLRFKSHITAYRKCDLEFDDILYCKLPGTDEFERFSNMVTSSKGTGPYPKQYKFWPYIPGVPYETTCRLQSNVVLVLPLQFNKTKRITGPEFNIRGDS